MCRTAHALCGTAKAQTLFRIGALLFLSVFLSFFYRCRTCLPVSAPALQFLPLFMNLPSSALVFSAACAPLLHDPL